MHRQPLTIVHTEASCGWGGQEIRILTEAAGMANRGHHVIIVAPAAAPIYQAALNRGLETQALPIGRKNLAGILAMRRWLSSHEVDLVNTHSSTDSWLTALACLGRRHPPAVVRTRHISAPVPLNRPTHWLYTRASRHIVTTGEALRETLIRRNRFASEMITSIPTGVDPARYSPGDRDAARSDLNLPSGRPIVGIVATLRSWKGHEYLVEAVAQLRRKDVLLLIVGDGPHRPTIEKTIERCGLTERVHLPGNREDVTPWLRAMDLFVLPSYANEGVPQAALQAMMVGLPIVATDIGGLPEAVIDGETGRVVPPRDSAALANAIETMLEDPEGAKRLGERARQLALESFSLERMLERMESLFYEVTAVKG